jgi:hypothetical protein
MASIIRLVLSHFTVTFPVIGLIASAIALIGAPKPLTAPVVIEALFAYFLLFSIGASFFYNFVTHIFFGAMAARFIGWQDTPFQAEVGFASLGYAAVSFLAWRGSFGLRLAAIVGPAIFLLGAAGGHIYQIITAHNFAPGNAGVLLYTDIFLPIIGFVLLWLRTAVAAIPLPGVLSRPYAAFFVAIAASACKMTRVPSSRAVGSAKSRMKTRRMSGRILASVSCSAT